MENLKNKFDGIINAKKAEKGAICARQEQYLQDTLDGCKDFVENFKFLEEYGFTFAIKKEHASGWTPSWQKWQHVLYMRLEGKHFACVYANIKDKEEKGIICESYQLNDHCCKTTYTAYKDILSDVADRIK